jgi:hypothetical protein
MGVQSDFLKGFTRPSKTEKCTTTMAEVGEVIGYANMVADNLEDFCDLEAIVHGSDNF